MTAYQHTKYITAYQKHMLTKNLRCYHIELNERLAQSHQPLEDYEFTGMSAEIIHNIACCLSGL